MSDNPHLVHGLATDRSAELRRLGGVRTNVTAARNTAGPLRERAGWVLVGLGLRLVVPRDRATNRLA